MVKDKDISSGDTSILLLQLLSERDMYGYETIGTPQKRSEFVSNLRAGTMYPLLHTMEAKRFLVSYEKEIQEGVRRHYSVTKEGRDVLVEKKEDWNTYSKAVEHVIGGALYGSA